jgi:NADH:ubiquinone reductase (H+-translocating)
MPFSRAARPRVVIVGAGFGGVAAAAGLRHAPVDITIIDRTNHFLFQPLLYQVATAALAPSDIASPIRAMFARQQNVTVLLGEVEGIDAAASVVKVADLADLPYDYLVLATGAASSWFGNAAWQENSLGLKSLADANALRQRLLSAFEAAERSQDPAEIQRLLTFVVVGGGASGVEMAGAIRDLARFTLRHDFRHIDPSRTRVLLFEGGPEILPGFPKKLTAYARRRLAVLGVEVHTSVKVDDVSEQGVVAGGQRYDAANVIWCAGVAASPAAAWVDAPKGRHGTIAVAPDCTVPARPEIFAIGDVASLQDADGHWLPGVGAVAKQQGAYVARVIAARCTQGLPPRAFRYRNQGSLAIIGRSSAVADLPYLKFSGVLAWLFWGCVHLALLAGFRNRIVVYIQWTSAWLFNARGARLINAEPLQRPRALHARRPSPP